MDFNIDLPGHGVPFKDKNLITSFQDYLRDFMNRRTRPHRRWTSPLQGVRRLCQWMDEKAKK